MSYDFDGIPKQEDYEWIDPTPDSTDYSWVSQPPINKDEKYSKVPLNPFEICTDNNCFSKGKKHWEKFHAFMNYQAIYFSPSYYLKYEHKQLQKVADIFYFTKYCRIPHQLLNISTDLILSDRIKKDINKIGVFIVSDCPFPTGDEFVLQFKDYEITQKFHFDYFKNLF